MDGASENKALQEVQGRLNARFPDLGDEVVEAAVRLAHSQLTGPIRDFVPILVEHAARERLAALGDYSSPHASRPVTLASHAAV